MGQTKKEAMKSDDQSGKSTEVVKTRRISASAGEIKELYSVLHQLVPGQSQRGLTVSPGSRLTKSQSMTMRKTNAVDGRTDMDRKNTSPASLPSYKFTAAQRSQSHTMLDVLASAPAMPAKRRGSLDNVLHFSNEKKDVVDGPLRTPVTKRKSIEGAVKCLEENRNKCVSKRASLVDAIGILARDPDSVHRLISEHAQSEEGRNRDSREINNSDSNNEQYGNGRKNSLLDNQMQQLLKSINELQSSYDLEPGMNDEEILRTLNCKGSVGTEMKELLTTLNDLNSHQNSSSVDQSRRGSKPDGRKARKETLDELEAFFFEKLKESTEKEKHQTISSRRMVKQSSIESKDSDISMPFSQSSSSRKESMESDNATMAYADEKCENQITVSQVPISLDKSVQEKFAQQVCERLETWLQKATALSEQEKENIRFSTGCQNCNSRKRSKQLSESSDKYFSASTTEAKSPSLAQQKHSMSSFELQTAPRQGSNVKKSRSLHNLIFGDEHHFKINLFQKFRSPKSGRKKKKLLKSSEDTNSVKLNRQRSRSLYDPPRRFHSTDLKIEDILERDAGGNHNRSQPLKSKLVPSASGPSRLSKSFSCEDLLASSRSCDNLVSMHKETHRKSSTDSFESAVSQRESRESLAGRQHLPTTLPLFYTPDASQATFLKMSRKVSKIGTQTNTLKETPPIRKQLIPHTERLKKYQRNMFYEERGEHDKREKSKFVSDSQSTSLIDPESPVSQPTLKKSEEFYNPKNRSKETEKTVNDEVFVAGHAQSYDSDELMELRHRTQNSESDNDSGCAASTEHLNKVCWPGTSEMGVQTDPVIVLAEGPYSL